MSSANPYAEIKAAEVQEFEKLNTFLRGLDSGGWVEQSYCSDWQVYQVVSHIGSGSRIGQRRLDAWINGAEPMTREDQQAVWALFDSLRPDQMLNEYLKAAGEYLVAEGSIADEAGLTEVEGFRGKQPLYVYQLGRLWELTSHSWDVYVARDRHATFPAAAVELLAPRLHMLNVPIDKERAQPLVENGVQFKLAGTGATYTLELSDRPRLNEGGTGAGLVVEGPAEEICRFVSGRHFVPGSKTELHAASGSSDDLAKLRRAFR
jgi:uncharacterized protein (TIGR03083 family)